MPERKPSETTSRGMPIVTQETYAKILDADRKGSERWGEMLNRVKERIIKEQPVLAAFLEGQVSGQWLFPSSSSRDRSGR